MTRAVAVSVACLLAGVFPSVARAHHWVPGACGLPTAQPLNVEYAEVSVSPTIRNQLFAPVRPPLVLATSGTALGAELRAGGAHTVHWTMRLITYAGSPGYPAAPEGIIAAADRLYARAVGTTGCATPSIALNELYGARLPPPWSVTNTMYRANLLAFLRRLHERGAHPYLLVITTPAPFTGSPEAAAWWRQAAAVSDLVLQVHFNGRFIHSLGALQAGKRRRGKMRRVIEQFARLGIPPQRLGLFHGFQSGHGGREGLPLASWLRVVKWEVLATRQVLTERAAAGVQIGSDWSWGWGDFPELSKVDPHKHITACVYLWVRDPSFCDGPTRAAAAGAPFNTSLDEGHVWLRPNVQCAYASHVIPTDVVARFAALRTESGLLGQRFALAALYQRILERPRAFVDPAEVAAAEEAIIATRFAGDRVAYEAALASVNADVTIARHVIGEQLRRRAITSSLPRGTTFEAWSLARQRRARESTVCVRDELPPLRVVDLADGLSFLRVSA